MTKPQHTWNGIQRAGRRPMQRQLLGRRSRWAWGLCLALCGWYLLPATAWAQTDLPIDIAALSKLREIHPPGGIRNSIASATLWNLVTSGPDGLVLDLSSVTTLIDGTEIDPTQIYGRVSAGPYPFEGESTRFSYKRFRTASAIRDGKATINVGYLAAGAHNSEGWVDRGTVAIRLELFIARPGPDRPLGIYDIYAAFLKTADGYQRCPWIVEGPFVSLVTSDAPGKALIHFITNEPVAAELLIEGQKPIHSSTRQEHEIEVGGLEPGKAYTYRVRIGAIESAPHQLRAALPKGAGPVRLAFCGDSREGSAGGMTEYMGVNHDVFERLAATAHVHGAHAFLMGGDLVNGYTTNVADFDTQLHAWKQAISGFWHERPVFVGMGNHESLFHTFQVGRGGKMQIDRWPYATESAEAVVERAVHNPVNAPAPADPRRPTYRENVFSFQTGLVRVIAFNNNYWFSQAPSRFGGAPEGYILDDQMDWIEQQLRAAEADPTVRYTLLFAQEPVFPCGGHSQDSMWYRGNNNIRAYTYRNGKLVPERAGIIEVRNRLARSVARSPKVAAVLCGDEHAYYRLRVDRQVPVGRPMEDDANRDGRIQWQADEAASPLADLPRPVWYVTCGGGGAPYYSEGKTPWTDYWASRPDPLAGYMYTSQHSVLLIEATSARIGLKCYNAFGELIDDIPDLMEFNR